MAVLALAVGAIVTAAFTITSIKLFDHNENRVLRLRAREVASVVSATLPALETPLAAAAALADSTGGNPRKFHAFMAPQVGAKRQFTSVSLWRLGRGAPSLVATVGVKPQLASLPKQAASFMRRVQRSRTVSVTGFLGASRPSVGFAYATPGAARFAVYSESPLPKDRRSTLQQNSAFSDLHYAIFLGRTKSRGNLLVTDLRQIPPAGRHDSESVPFGDTALTILVTPNGPLGGSFFAVLRWIILAVGGVISIAAALVAERLARRRRHAEELSGVLDRIAAENHRLYTEQRGIAETLQHALLPDVMPAIGGLQVSARYVPAGPAIDVGGDWYDVVAAGERRAFMVIGDVSGHGLRAATTMASLRHATLAYAAEGASPGDVLSKLSTFVASDDHDYFATVLCALIDVDAHQLTMASAGHFPPLLINNGDGGFAEVDSDVPIGVRGDVRYRDTTVSVKPGTTLVAFTDGLVERRGEVIDEGLERLREAASGRQLTLAELVGLLVTELASHDHHDDTAIVGIRWRS